MDALPTLFQRSTGLLNQGWDLWLQMREKRMGRAATEFIDLLGRQPSEADRHLPRIIKAMRHAPLGVTGPAWILTCQKELSIARPDLLEAYYRGVIGRQSHAQVLSVLLRQRPEGIVLELEDVDRVIKLDKDNKYGRQELLTLLMDELPVYKDFCLLEHFLEKTRGMRREKHFTHPVGGLVRGWGKTFDVIDVPMAERAIRLLDRYWMLEDYKGEPPAQYLLGKICQWVNDGKVPEEVIGQLLEQGVSWAGVDEGDKAAAAYIRRHPVWRQSVLSQQMDGRKGPVTPLRRM